MKTSSAFFTLIKPFSGLAIAMVFLTTIASLLEGVTLSLTIPLLNKIVGSNTGSELSVDNPLIGSLLVFFKGFPDEYQIQVIILSLLALVIVKGAFRFLADFSLRILMLKSGLNLRTICIDRFLSLGLAYYSKVKGGNLLSYVNEQAQRCEQLTLYIGAIFSESLIIASFLILLLNISWQLTLVAIILLGLVAFSLKVVVKAVKVEGRIASQTIELFSGQVFEVITGIRVIQAFTAEAYEKDRLIKTLKQRYQAERKSYAGQVAIQPISDTLGILILVILGFLGTQILSDTLILPLLLTFLLVLLRMFPRINQLNSLRTSLANFSESFQSIHYFLQETKISDVPDGLLKFKTLQSAITFDKVMFAHSESLNPTLKSISFTLPKGTTIALVGESGSGKSTLADLLLRYYDPQQGKVSIDGVNLRSFELESLRRKIAVVSQDTFLFNATIRENIRYGAPDAKDSEILEAAINAYAEDFILNLPDGFDTVIGDRGVRLSGGQRQRLAIARAILRNPEILILDEATSALDSTSERIVQKALDDVSQNKTVLVIAHRLSTIQTADKIIVLKQGEIVESGNHQELISLGGYYCYMAKTQGMG